MKVYLYSFFKLQYYMQVTVQLHTLLDSFFLHVG